jgi:hypothetical protein
MKRYLTLRELSQELSIPKSTVVKYKDFYGEFLPMAGDGKRKKFDRVAIEVLTLIRHRREEQKKDWGEIREELEARFSEKKPEETKTAVAAHSAPAAASVSVARHEPPDRRIEHLTHLMLALAGEMIQMRGALRELDSHVQASDGAGGRIDAMEADLRRMRDETRAMAEDIKELNNIAARNDLKSKKRFEIVLSQLRGEINNLGAGISRASAGGGPGAETTKKLVEKVQNWMQEHAALQTRYMMLLQENENLKSRDRDRVRETRVAAPAPEDKPRGLRARFLGSSGRK